MTEDPQDPKDRSNPTPVRQTVASNGISTPLLVALACVILSVATQSPIFVMLR